MRRLRVIPVLQYNGVGLVKTVGFKAPKYVGDPINAVKIFNEKEVDELVFIDITATIEKRAPDYKKIEEIAGECFMPLAYGGGITSIEQIKKILNLGIEKVILNTSAAENISLITEAANTFGSQSIVVSVDVKKKLFGGYEVCYQSGKKKLKKTPSQFAREMEAAGCGEIIIYSIDKDGSYTGYDLALIKSISSIVNIPVIALGGASKISDFTEAVLQGGASAVAAGSLFVYHGPHKAVLINYPHQEKLITEFYSLV